MCAAATRRSAHLQSRIVTRSTTPQAVVDLQHLLHGGRHACVRLHSCSATADQRELERLTVTLTELRDEVADASLSYRYFRRAPLLGQIACGWRTAASTPHAQWPRVLQRPSHAVALSDSRLRSGERPLTNKQQPAPQVKKLIAVSIARPERSSIAT